MTPGHPTVSVILCTFERTADLLATLGSLRATAMPKGWSGELLVVDSSRGEDTRRALRELTPIPHLPLRVLHEPRRGKAHALNTAIAAARGEVLLFTDDDVRVPPHWIEAMAQPLLCGAADAVAGGVHLAPELARPWMEPFHRGWMASTEVLDARAPEALIGANMALSRRALDRVPIFDPELGSGSALGGCDESLFSFQLRAAGCRIVAAFQASVEHHFDPSRLSRQCFLDRAKIEGRSSAYIAHHWRHETLARPYLRLLDLWARLFVKRWRTRREWTAPEGAPLWELHRLIHLNFARQYLRERRRPRHYARHGLVKLAADGSPVQPAHREVAVERAPAEASATRP